MVLNSEDLRKIAHYIKELDIENQNLKKQSAATEFLFDQIGNGFIEIPKDKFEFKYKIAEYTDQNLEVLEEASKMASTNMHFNALGAIDNSNTNIHKSAESNFMQEIINMRRN